MAWFQIIRVRKTLKGTGTKFLILRRAYLHGPDEAPQEWEDPKNGLVRHPLDTPGSALKKF